MTKSEFVNWLKFMSEAKREATIQKITSLGFSPVLLRDGERELLPEVMGEKRVCPLCCSMHISKKGFSDNGKTQRYLCVDCGKRFRFSRRPLLEGFEYDPSLPGRLIELVLVNADDFVCSEMLGLSPAAVSNLLERILCLAARVRKGR